MTFGSFLKSFLHPTKIIGIFGQKWKTSEIHFSLTFSKLSGESIEKQINITWESG